MPQEDASAASAGGNPAEIALMISDHRRAAKLSQAALGRFASAFGKRLVISFE